MLSSKEVKFVGEMVCGKTRRKPQQTVEEMSRLMLVRDVYHETMKDQNVCVVLPDGKTEAEVFGEYLTPVRSRLRRRNVTVVWYKELTVEHLESNNCVVDMSIL